MVAADGLGAHVPAQGQGTKDQVGGDRMLKDLTEVGIQFFYKRWN